MYDESNHDKLEYWVSKIYSGQSIYIYYIYVNAYYDIWSIIYQYQHPITSNDHHIVSTLKSTVGTFARFYINKGILPHIHAQLTQISLIFSFTCPTTVLRLNFNMSIYNSMNIILVYFLCFHFTSPHCNIFHQSIALLFLYS